MEYDLQAETVNLEIVILKLSNEIETKTIQLHKLQGRYEYMIALLKSKMVVKQEDITVEQKMYQ